MSRPQACVTSALDCPPPPQFSLSKLSCSWSGAELSNRKFVSQNSSLAKFKPSHSSPSARQRNQDVFAGVRVGCCPAPDGCPQERSLADRGKSRQWQNRIDHL